MIKHIVVTRLALKWKYHELGMDWNDWLNKSIYLMDNYCRPSLKNQTDQDFTLLTLVDKSVKYAGKSLKNEKIIMTRPGDIREQIINAVNSYVSTIDENWVIMTRIDRDDCLRKDYISNIKRYYNSGGSGFADLYYSLTYDVAKNTIHDSPKYHQPISPFVSVLENNIDGKIPCWPFKVNHGQIGNFMKGVKLKSLSAMQVIHGHNVLNKVFGDKIKINRKDYGL